MVQYDDFDEFLFLARQLFRDTPDRTRFVTKYRHASNRLEVKVTDDKVCLKYVATTADDLLRVERLNLEFLTLMSQ